MIKREETKPTWEDIWINCPAGNEAKQTLYNFYLEFPELHSYIEKSPSGKLLCAVSGKEINSVDDCYMLHVILPKFDDIDYDKIYFPKTNKHIIIPIKKGVEM